MKPEAMMLARGKAQSWFYMGMLIPVGIHKGLVHESHAGKWGKGVI